MWRNGFWGFKCIILIPLALIVISCATLKPGETKFRLVGEGIATKEPGERPEDTKKRADDAAKMDVGLRFKNSITARQKLAALFPKLTDTLLDLNKPLPEPMQKNLYIADWNEKKLLGQPAIYSYAVLPFRAPNPILSAGVSLLFPGLGQLYNETPSLGYLLAGAISTGTAIYTVLQYDDWNTKYRRETKIEKIDEYYDEKNKWYKYAQFAVVGYSIVAIFSSVQAYTMASSNQEALEYIRRGGRPLSENIKMHIDPASKIYILAFSYDIHSSRTHK